MSAAGDGMMFARMLGFGISPAEGRKLPKLGYPKKRRRLGSTLDY
jgi:hypothetical protein